MTNIHHYTDASGLLGILQHKELWATDVLYLNDASELEHGFDLARRRLPYNDASRGWPAGLGALLAAQLGTAEESVSNTRTCVACFCSANDLLSQWRGYANGVGGFSLGFALDALAPYNESSEPPIFLEEVEYSEVEQVKYLEFWLKQMGDEDTNPLSRIPNVSSVDDLHEDIINDLVQGVRACIYVAAVKWKNEGFSEEREVRLVTAGTVQELDLRFRSRGTMIVPYVGISLTDENGNSPLRSVTVGPNPQQKFVAQAVEWALQKNGFSSVEVNQSLIPFRV